MTFWETLWSIFTIFVFIAYLMLMFSIVQDLFRDRELNGWWKAIWFVALIFIPVLTALVYVIARGGGMAERSHRVAVQTEQAAKSYIREAAGTSPAEQIASAAQLLQAGTITEDEFARLKAHAMSSTTSGSHAA
ncbi:SHOCT domain-containing protein [Leucobacter sp. M11]|uniref:SHOCT domain-containing protein n=1 Tax=Leucobacter sp. M11 TaxID=2993565 RepID=UPI002D805D91|nr:SHOCT domain-containing protein [Leucobacter sp. M11]MEB4614504.1 SHOCT domain-containing protein [Leucobacter sp. M11]